MAIMETMTCPRKAFLREAIPASIIKAGTLRKIMKDVLLDSPFNIREYDLNKKVDAAFEAASMKMFGFEKESECARMKALLWRYISHENGQSHNDILSQGFSNEVTVLGKKRTISAHRLIDRGTALEVVRYLYKSPEFSYNGRTLETCPEMNPDLLVLQRTGEAEAAKLGIDTSKKPVFASYYYLKSKNDRSKQLDTYFDERRGNNIINYHFISADEAKIAALYKNAKVDVKETCSDEKSCYDCIFNDLCHTEFVKRKLEEMPTVEETPLNSIHMTKAQERFVMFENGQCRVNAVAGSGKTTIVTLRSLRLIEEGCPPEGILMITFTEKAKEEMRARLRRYAKGATLKDENIDTSKIVVETFNSFGQGLLDEYYAKLGFTKAPALVDEIIKKDIIATILESHRTLPIDYNNPFLDLPNASGAVIQIGRIIDAMKSAHVQTADDAEPLLSKDLKPRAAELLDIYKDYNAELVKRNMIDYEDQLRLILQLKPFGIFETLPYRHIVVDEFQDSDPNQIGLILEIARADKQLRSIVVVGDELQAIYGFRNANPENLINFATYFPAMIDIPLEDNFRSQTPIIAMANKILAKEARIAKVIRANRKEKGLNPVVMEVEKLEDERSLYVRQVEKLINDGTPPKDIAVMCRTKSELIGIQKALTDKGIPTMLRVPEIIGQAPYVKAIIALASFLLNHKDVMSLALYRKSLGEDPFDADALKKEAEELGKTYDALSTEEERILFFTGMIKDACEDYVAKAFADKVMMKGFHTAHDIFTFCVKYKEYNVKETISTAREDVDAVTLITVHSAKGLEWPVVLLSLRKFKPMNEEEHRLLYVAVTRAKEKLLITYPKKQGTLVSLLK